MEGITVTVTKEDDKQNWCVVYGKSYVNHAWGIGSSSAEEEVKTWKIAEICIWP